MSTSEESVWEYTRFPLLIQNPSWLVPPDADGVTTTSNLMWTISRFSKRSISPAACTVQGKSTLSWNWVNSWLLVAGGSGPPWADLSPAARERRTWCGNTCDLYAWFQSKLLHLCFNITDQDRSVQSLNQVYKSQVFLYKIYEMPPCCWETNQFSWLAPDIRAYWACPDFISQYLQFIDWVQGNSPHRTISNSNV